MHLTLDDHRVDDVAEVVACAEVDDSHDAGVGIDLDLADVRARREREVRRIVERRLVQTRLELVERIVVRDVSAQRDLPERLAAIGAGHREFPVLRGLRPVPVRIQTQFLAKVLVQLIRSA